MIVEQQDQASGAKRGRKGSTKPPLAIALIDPRTGRNFGPAVAIGAAKSSVQLTGDWGFWPDAVVIGTSDSLYVYAKEVERKPPGREY